MKKILSLSIVILLSAFLFSLVSCSRVSTVKVKTNKKVVEMVRTWDRNISFYTSKKDPLKSTEGLRQAEIACFGRNLKDKIQAFYNAAEIRKEYGDAVQVIGPDNPIFSMQDGPRLYLTSREFEPKLKEAVKVEFTE